MLTAYAFVAFNVAGYLLAIWRGPFWGLLVYVNLYFNSPNPEINWWASYFIIPSVRWSLISIVVLFFSMLLHSKMLSKHKFRSLTWVFIFLALTVTIAFFNAVDRDNAYAYSYKVFIYCISTYCIVRCIQTRQQLRLIMLALILMVTNLSLNAYLYGERINARLEGTGAVDAFGANQFGLLLASVIPFTIPFILSGKPYERILCLLSLPFVINAFVLCNSRGALVAVAVSTVLVFMFFADRKIRRIIVVCLLCALPVLYYLSDEYFALRISSLLGFKTAISDTVEAERLSSGRTEIWRYGLDMAKDYPLGAGPNGFKQLARFYMPHEMLSFHPDDPYGVRAAHNTYLQVLVEQGILGLCIFLIMCLHTMTLLVRSLKSVQLFRRESLFWKYAVAALSLSLVVSLMGGMVYSRVYYEFFWWQIAFTVVLYSLLTATHGTLPDDGTGSMVVPSE